MTGPKPSPGANRAAQGGSPNEGAPVTYRVILWLSIHDGSGGQHPLDGNAPSSQLWWTARNTGFVPDPQRDDRVILWPDDGDPLAGPLWNARKRYMDAAGGWHVELTRAVLNPEQQMWQRARAEMAHTGRWNELHHWETSVDGDLQQKLRAGGWFQRSVTPPPVTAPVVEQEGADQPLPPSG